MDNLKKIIPNACTSLNLLFGMCSLMYTVSGNLTGGALCIFLALVADGLDGRIARFFGVSSELGKEMDSLCDLGSFGVAPAMLAYCFYLHNFGYVGQAVAIAFALCGMWRLARFNVNTDVVHGYFMGLAIPAGACVVASSALLFSALSVPIVEYGYAYPSMIAILSYLMISRIHYPNFKGDGAEKNYGVAKVAAAVVFAAVVFFGQAAMPYAVLFAATFTYATFGIINSLCALFVKEEQE